MSEVDAEQGRVALRRTAFFPGGGGQPFDIGTLEWADGPSEVTAPVTKVGRDRETGRIWHWLEGGALPGPDAEVSGVLDWDRRHLTMRTHTALHILCGVIWSEFGLAVTGGNMDPARAGSTSRSSRCPPSSVSRSSAGSTRRSTPLARSWSTSSVVTSPTRTRR